MKKGYIPFLFVLFWGCSSFVVPEYHGPVTDHYDGKQFFNYEPSEDKSLWTVLKWRWSGDRPKWPKDIPVTPTLPEKNLPWDTLRLTFVNHSTVLVQTDQASFLIDPVWSDKVGPYFFLGPSRFHEPGVRLEHLPPIDFILISHNHYDHLDIPTLELIQERQKGPASTPPTVLAGLGNAAFLKQNGITNAVDLDWWQEYRINETVRVVGVPAHHWSFRAWGNRRQTLWMGFVVMAKNRKIFYAGDTGASRHFQLIRNRMGVMDLCLFPIGSYLPRWFMKDNHISPEEAVTFHKELGCKKSLGVHFGTFQLNDEEYGQPEKDLATALANQGVRAEDFRVLQPGQFWDL